MKSQNAKLSKDSPRAMLSSKFPLFAYLILGVYICIFLVSAWFSSYQNALALQMREDFEQEKNQLLDEIHELELLEAELTSIERIGRISKNLHMVQPSSDQIQTLKAQPKRMSE